MATPRDYYEVLGIPKNADKKAIKNAFRDLALKFHPDRNKAPDAEERFKEIAEAYAILSDPKKRREYDLRGHAGVAGFSQEDLFGGINFDDLFGDTGSGMGFGSSIFDRFFGRRRAPSGGRNLEIAIEVPLFRIVTGGEEPVHIRRSRPCPACKGNGAKDGSAFHACAKCGGSGQNVHENQKSGVFFKQITTCPECGGQGHFIDQACPDCGGSGNKEHVETLTIQIPVGAEEGMMLRIPGHGMPAPDGSGPPGDLLVIIRTRSDSRFTRQGADLWRREKIDVEDAVLGADITVPSLDGEIAVSVPPGSQPGEVLRVQGKGLPAFGGNQRGDYFIRLDVRIPDKLSKQARSLYGELQKLKHQ